MKIRKSTAIILISALFFIGCAKCPRVAQKTDGHECQWIDGYTWCAKLKECKRPWELAEKEGFENSYEAFDKYCGN